MSDIDSDDCGSKPREKLPWEEYNKFFTFKRTGKNGNFIVSCNLCCIGNELSVTKTSTYNMKIHLQRKHEQKLGELNKSIESSRKRKREICDSNQRQKQLKLSSLKDGRFSFSGENQESIDNKLLEWIVDGLHPFSEVDRPSFSDLWQSLTKKKLMCSATLKKKLGEQYERMKSSMLDEFEKVSFVSATADCWTAHHRSFLGVTCHWLDPLSLERKSAALACRRLIGSHTYDVLAKELQDIFIRYHIHNKVVGVVTDNGSNFVKAFKEFSASEPEDSQESDVVEEEITEILATGDCTLPPHIRCAAHTLHLVAVKDSEKAASSDANYKRLFRSAFAKAQALWNKSRQSSQVADIVKKQLGACLIVPNATRWNSVHSAVSALCQHFTKHEEKVHAISDAVGLCRFSPHEIEFLKEYAEVTQPLAEAIDILQGDKKVSIGYLLPTLHQLLRILGLKLDSGDVAHCDALARAIVDGVKQRFAGILWDKDTVLAACFHPRFKLSWLESEKKSEARRWMEKAVSHDTKESSACQNEEKQLDDFEDFFKFEQTQSETELQELCRFLKDGPKPVETLHSYSSKFKEIFIKLNTVMPSSGAVERLFSVGGNLFSSRRTRLTDQNFEMQLLLKFNRQLNLV